MSSTTIRTSTPRFFAFASACITCKRKLTAVCSHQTRIGNLDAHLI
ncbi:hypothetical protein CX016_004436 [Salmonella enterica subsp. enterica serovar Javiana]|nr:hypothetical protein [Salmonella enterica subsp. enterica serovar Javiana]